MKILLVNPEVPPSYWSFPEQMKFYGSKTLLPPLGLLTLAALLPKEWEVRLIDLAAQSRSDLDWDWPDVVMLTGMLIQRQNLLDLVTEAKGRGKTVVVGGPYATSVPHEPLEAGCHILVKGEAENTISNLLHSLCGHETGIVIESPEKPDLSKSPIPRFDLLNIKNYSTMAIQTSRGCPFDCEFCDIVNLYGAKTRHKAPSQVVAEMDAIYKLGWRDWVFICDDNFIGSKKHAKALLKEMNTWMKAHSSPFCFITQVSVNLGQDIELIDLMTEPNFSTVFVGLESPDEEALAAANKFQNIQNPLLESVENIKKNGLTVLGSFVIGLDGEKPGTGEKIMSFVEAANLPVVMFNKLQATPNTRLWNRLEREGRLRTKLGSGNYLYGKLNFEPLRPEHEIQQDFVHCWDRSYDSSNFLKRAYNYYLAMRPTRLALAKKQGLKIGCDEPKQPFDPVRFFTDIKRLLRLSWRQGVISKSRLQYWKQLLGILKHNPTRLVQYLSACATGEDMFKIKRNVIDEGKKSLIS